MNLTDTIVPRSDQLNAEDLLTGPQTVTITEVRKGSTEQPVEIVTAEFGDGRPFKPSKTVRRILVAAWGAEASAYVGRRMTLYRDPAVKFGGLDVGGIRVSHMSHLDKPLKIALTVTRGKRAPYVVEPLKDDEPAPAKQPTAKQVADAIAHYADKWQVPLDRLEARIGRPSSRWTARDMTMLRAVSTELANGATTAGVEFPETVNLPDDDSSEPTDEQYALYDDEAAGAET